MSVLEEGVHGRVSLHHVQDSGGNFKVFQQLLELKSYGGKELVWVKHYKKENRKNSGQNPWEGMNL